MPRQPGRFLLATFLSITALGVIVAAINTQGGPIPGPLPVFPSDNWWNLDISNVPVDPASASYITFIGPARTMHPDFGGDVSPGSVQVYGFPYAVVDGTTTKRTVQFQYYKESDGVDHTTQQSFPFYPIPDEAIAQAHWIEGGDPGTVDRRSSEDRHLLIVDRDHRHLYELYNVFYDGSQWHAGSGAFFDLNANGRRPDGWTSADAAGLAILPGLVRYDEVFGAGEIGHALRVTVRATNGYVYPASHVAGTTPGALPMGARLRLKASRNISGFTPEAQKIFRAMQRYGLIVADNGTDLYVSGTYDTRWNNGVLNPAFGALTANDFDVVTLGFQPPPATRVIGLAGNLAFGQVQMGTTAQALLTIANSGNAPLTVSSINYPAGFSGNWGSGTIAPGSSQAVTVTFAPMAATAYGGTVSVMADQTSGTPTIGASGMGKVPPTRIISLSGNLAFGAVQIGTTATSTLTIANTGNSTLTVSGITYPAGFSGNWSGTIAAGGSRAVTVTFAPVAATSYGGTLTVSGDQTSGTNTTVVSGGGRRAAPGDFDGDGKADVTVFRPSTGGWYSLRSRNGFAASTARTWGASTDVVVPGDYDGDGTIDPAVFRPSTGGWYVLQSSTNYTSSIAVTWGIGTDLPVPGDYDGDGKTDPAVFRPSSGGWYFLKSSSGYTASGAVAWGVGTDTPVSGDYDGDGKADPGVFRPSTGGWYVLKSSAGYTASAGYTWGASTDVAVPGDYDGDGKTDPAVFRPSTGGWYFLQSSTGYTSSGAASWGAGTDKPVPGDYDGDGKIDPAVFRPSTGVWAILKSSTNYTSSIGVSWGVGTDTPILQRP